MSNPSSTLLTPEEVLGPPPPDTPATPATPLSGPAPRMSRPVPQAPPAPEAILGTPPAEQPSIFGGAMDLGAALGADLTRRNTGDGSSTPALDNYFDHTSAGNILKAFGQNVSAPFRILDELNTADGGPETIKFLKDAGVYDDWAKAHAANATAFRNGTLRPLALAAAATRTMVGPEIAGLKEYASGLGGAFEQLRQDLAGQPQDMNAVMRDPVWENRVVPIIKNLVGQVPVMGTSASSLFDTFGLAAAFVGLPQMTHFAATNLATVLVKTTNAILGPPELRHALPEAEDIRQTADRMTFWSQFAGAGAKGAIPPLEERLAKAQYYGTVKPPPSADDTAGGIARKAQDNATQMKEAGVPEPVQPAPGAPSPDIASTPAGPPTRPTPPRDVHTVAREIAPDVFTKFDPLQRRDQWYNDWISELRTARDNDPRLRAAQNEIDTILGKVGGVEERLTGRARDRIDDLRGYIDDFKSVDSPDMARVKQEKLANWQAMQDLQPQVRAAYSEAADRLAREVPEAAPEVMEPVTPSPVSSAPVPVVEATPEVTPSLAPRTDLPLETAHIQTVEDIANDISRQAQAAGRPKDEADDFGKAVASAYQSDSAAFGGQRGTAAELYREHPFSITGALKPVKGQRTFAQRVMARGYDVAKNIPGMKAVLPHLLPSEVATATKTFSENLLDAFKEISRHAEEMASVSYAGRAKRGWYKNAATAIRQVFGEDSDRFTALLAGLSPQISVEGNLENALRTWTAWEEAGRSTDPAVIRRIMGENVRGEKGEASVMTAWLYNGQRALTHPDPATLELSGPKVNSFAQNLRGYMDAVTNDSWMATYFALDKDFLKGQSGPNRIDPFGKYFTRASPNYVAISAMTRRVAKILSDRTGETWTPAEVQETVWSWAKTLYEKRDSAGEDRITRDILKAGDLTHEDIANTPDFASMLIQGVYRKILEAGGYGEELENLGRSVEDRFIVNRETGPSGDVTRAEGAGIAQPAFERHLQRAADRLEDVLAARREGVTYGQSATGAEAGELPERGGVSGSAERLETPRGAREAYDRGEPLAGLPRKATIPGVGSVDVGPIQRIRDTADAYMKSAGREHTPVMTYVKVDPDTSRAIAAAFDEMKDDPDNPEVKRAYEAMARETLAQWEFVKKTGLKVEFFDPKNDPYHASPRLAIQDIKDHNHLWVFSTDDGYGETPVTAQDIHHNPMLAPVPGETISGRTPRINDIFRIVHDFFGHAQEGNGFRVDGEENAWRVHSTMYSLEARRAMTTETRGQNSWLNYGPYGESNRTASTENTIFADQKVGLLPEWVSETDVNKELEQGGRRASITFRDMHSIVRLMKSADASSLIHEFFHHLLERLRANAQHPLAPQWLKDDWATIKNEYDLKDDGEIPRKVHEQVARGGERYVMEGMAPNRAMGGVFKRMQARMLAIYNTLADLRVTISPAVRSVFDRMLGEPDQRTIITPPRSGARMLADVHEVDAQTTSPEHAALAADQIRSEIDQTLQRIAPEIHNALPHKSAGQASPIQGAHPLPAGGANEAGIAPGNAGGAEAAGTIAAGRNRPAQAGNVVRTEPSGAGGPAGGEHGVGEPTTGESGAGEPATGGAGLGAGRGRGELEFIEGTGAPTVSEFARNIEARAVLAGMPSDFFGELPVHGVMSKADQALRAINLLHDDPAGAMAVAMAERDPPAGLMRPFVIKAVENRARMEGDWETLRQLATNQKLANERTTIGRQLGAMAEVDPTDPVAAIRAVQKARMAKAVDLRTMASDVGAMKEAIRKAPSKSTWSAFIDEITCK